MAQHSQQQFVELLKNDPTKRAAVIADIKNVLTSHGLADADLHAFADDGGDVAVTVYRDGPSKSQWVVS